MPRMLRLAPLPVPSARWDDEPTYCLQVNDEWVSHILGQLEPLDTDDAWTGTPEEKESARQQVAEIMAALMEACVPVNPYFVGEVRLFAHIDIPDGWVNCYGQALSRTTYADLFAVLGTVHGEGDGSTTFNVPQYRGKFFVGFEPVPREDYHLGHTGGEEAHALTADENGPHTHTEHVQASAGSGSGPYIQAQRSLQNAYQTGSSGLGEPHENRPPWGVVVPAIYTGVTSG